MSHQLLNEGVKTNNPNSIKFSRDYSLLSKIGTIHFQPQNGNLRCGNCTARSYHFSVSPEGCCVFIIGNWYQSYAKYKFKWSNTFDFCKEKQIYEENYEFWREWIYTKHKRILARYKCQLFKEISVKSILRCLVCPAKVILFHSF